MPKPLIQTTGRRKEAVARVRLRPGTGVVVINASAIAVNPRKLADKRYYRHSGYPGGIKSESMEHLLARNPERVVRLAVKGMLPKGPLGRQMLKRLRVYPGAQHPHIAQNPQPRALSSARAR